MEFLHELKHTNLLIILFVIPVVVVLALGWEFQKGVIGDVPFAVLDNDNSGLSRTVIQAFQDSGTFEITYASTAEAIEGAIQDGTVRAAMIIPEHFERDVKTAKSPTILMVYDGAAMSVTSTVKAKATEILGTLKVGVTMKQLQGRLNMSEQKSLHVAMPIEMDTRNLYNPTKNMGYFLLPGVVISITQSALALVCALGMSIGKGKKACYAAKKIAFYGILAWVTYTTNILVLVHVYQLPMNGNLYTVLALGAGLCFAISAFGCAISVWIRNGYTAIMAVGMLVVPNMVMGGYSWPFIAMPAFYQRMCVFIPFYHVANSVRSIMLSGSVDHLADHFLYTIYFGLFSYCLCVLGLYVLDAPAKKQGEGEVAHVS